MPEILVKQAKQKTLHLGLKFNERPTQTLAAPSVVLEITPDGLPLFRVDGTPGFESPALEDGLRLDRMTLEQEDIQRAGLSG